MTPFILASFAAFFVTVNLIQSAALFSALTEDARGRSSGAWRSRAPSSPPGSSSASRSSVTTCSG